MNVLHGELLQLIAFATNAKTLQNSAFLQEFTELLEAQQEQLEAVCRRQDLLATAYFDVIFGIPDLV